LRRSRYSYFVQLERCTYCDTGAVLKRALASERDESELSHRRCRSFSVIGHKRPERDEVLALTSRSRFLALLFVPLDAQDGRGDNCDCLCETVERGRCDDDRKRRKRDRTKDDEDEMRGR